jgi:hypothetical protein
MAGKRRAEKRNPDKRKPRGAGPSETTDASATGRVRCPLCSRQVSFEGDDAPAALNRHFETDCTWRHTSRSPTRSAKRR